MDIRSAARQVEEARGMLTQAISDATVCQLDIDVFADPAPCGPSWVFVPDPQALRRAVAALDCALEDLDGITRRPSAPVVELVVNPIPTNIPDETIYARIPAQRGA